VKNSVCIIGLGYVGLTLSLKFCQKNFQVIGYDTDKKIISDLKNSKSHVFEEGLDKNLKKYINNKKFKPVNEIPKKLNTYIITVGTPIIKKYNMYKPNLEHIKNVTAKLSKIIKINSLLIYRSTLPLGSSRNVIYKLLKKNNKIQSKFLLGFAPERTAEGKALKELSKLPQIVSGIDSASLAKTSNLFKKICDEVIEVDSLEEAELIKLTNNAYRDLSFAFSNQIALICSKFDINANRLINFCNYKYPRSLVPMPSPGVGGPCLTKDPYILNYSLKDKRSIFSYGRDINDKILDHLIVNSLNKINNAKIDVKKKILFCGLSFKGYPVTKDLRGSAFIMFYRKYIKNKNTQLFYYDKLFNKNDLLNYQIKEFQFKDKIKFDAIFFLNNSPSLKKISIKNINKVISKKTHIFDFWRIIHNSKNKLKTKNYYEIGQI